MPTEEAQARLPLLGPAASGGRGQLGRQGESAQHQERGHGSLRFQASEQHSHPQSQGAPGTRPRRPPPYKRRGNSIQRRQEGFTTTCGAATARRSRGGARKGRKKVRGGRLWRGQGTASFENMEDRTYIDRKSTHLNSSPYC